jgi:hypothetical protein
VCTCEVLACLICSVCARHRLVRTAYDKAVMLLSRQTFLNGMLVFRLESGMSGMHKSKGDATHDVTHEE